jgi:hypothetical protein
MKIAPVRTVRVEVMLASFPCGRDVATKPTPSILMAVELGDKLPPLKSVVGPGRTRSLSTDKEKGRALSTGTYVHA